MPPDKAFLKFTAADPLTTIITADSHAGLPGPDGKPINTFATPTVFIQANDFTAENLTFANSAGPQGQAVALTTMGDRGIFRNCRFLGYQDTLLAQEKRQLFDRCYIEGAVDFIFGGSAAWFNDCHIQVTAKGYITAANTPKDQRYGYVFSHCRIMNAPGVATYLGRPWRPYAFTFFLETEMSEAVQPVGWNNWSDPAREKTVRYGEYRSTGAGANAGKRVAWAHRLTAEEAAALTPEKALAGIDGWNPHTGTVRSRVEIREASGPDRPAPLPKGRALLATMGSGKPEDGLRLASSADGYKWTAIGNAPIAPAAGRILQSPDGVFHLVWASATKGDKGFHYANSKDLIHWTAPRSIEIMAKENALDLVSPNLYFDSTKSEFIVTWASTMAKNFIQAFQEDVENNPRIWYATTRDFETFSDPKLFFDPNYSVKDAVILKDGARYLLVHNDNARLMLNLRVAASDAAIGPWGPSSDGFTAKFTESPAAVQLGGEWWIYQSNSRSGAVGLLKTRDFWTFTDAARAVVFPQGRYPLSVVEVRAEIIARL